MRLIKFTHSGNSSIFGAFSAGDMLRCGADAARHFVTEARCAVYADAAPEPAAEAQPPAAPEQAAKAPRRSRKET
jgi:hypothetical protein